MPKFELNFSDPAANHAWQERPGAYYWQRTSLYLPSTTINQLGPTDYLTLAGLWPSNSGTAGWWLRVRQGGQLYVYGYDGNGTAREFRVYGTLPQDQWVELELGLHSQNGPGVKRAFAFLVNGNFYGWYHQGRMAGETYDRAAVGILSTNSSAPLMVFVDQWQQVSNGLFPGGPDNRSTSNLQEQDYRNQSGVQWQIDWSTWGNDLRLDPQYGLYSNSDRLQSGRNLDRMPDLTSGWAEIEVDWPKGTPPTQPNGYFGPMVGFRKEINREENLEVIPIGQGNGNVNLALEAWVNGTPDIRAQWPLPLASIGGSHIPEPSDIIRTRWKQVDAANLNIRASYYDASAATWHTDVISMTLNLTNIGGVNFTDGYHAASSITIDSPAYSIRRYRLGAIETYPDAATMPTPTPTATNTPTVTYTPTHTPTSGSLPTNTPTNTPIPPTATPTSTYTATPTLTPTNPPASVITFTAQISASANDVNQDGSSLNLNSTTLWLGNAASTTSSYTALRFTNLNIPPGATINSARLQVYASQNSWISLNMTLAAEATGNSAAFSAGSPPAQRLLTSQQVSHNSNTQWLANTWYTLDEMGPVIQEVINRPDWQSGNHLAIIVRGSGSAWARKFISTFDGSATNAPKLMLNYKTDSPINTPTPTATPSNTPISAPTNTPTFTPTPIPDIIFADGFELGNLSAWSASTTDAGDLSVSPAAVLVGSRGLQAVIDDNIALYVTDDRPNGEPRYRARFYFDPNSIPMVSGNAHHLFYGYTGTSTVVLRLEFRFSGGVYQIRTALLNDSTSWTNSSWFTLSDAPHFIELDWRAATAPGANNGGLTLWLDGIQQANLSGIDNDTRRIDRVRLGPVAGLDTGTRGTYFIDAFESHRTSSIGPQTTSSGEVSMVDNENNKIYLPIIFKP